MQQSLFLLCYVFYSLKKLGESEHRCSIAEANCPKQRPQGGFGKKNGNKKSTVELERFLILAS